MKSEQQIQDAARVIVSFTDSYTQNQQEKQNEQIESESTSSITLIVSSLRQLRNQFWNNNNTCKLVIQIPKLLRSLSSLSLYKIGTHFGLELNQQRLEVRSWSRECLYQIQRRGDEQDQQDLVNNEYGRVMFITFCTAGGISDEQDEEIYFGLENISVFLKDLHEGRTYQPSIQPLPLLARRTEEQIEEEGADEEIDTQMKNNGLCDVIKSNAKWAKATTLNNFINRN
ncbi:MAG: hypothetical protein EZS28_007389 [Streblomastix strix]|uniref:Uncharacterized protein n=1 Tax=Streblomastix strix TaxID=222440 RepID=A0A5J4WQC5_9EUKA|nr:MAG: hypothetical protein EZS28_007389 [Streblomastix strix]